MTVTTKIVVQQAVSVDPANVVVGKYPRYIINMGSSISSITATELATAVDQAQTAAIAAKTSEIIAGNYAEDAQGYQEQARVSATAAEISENNAATSATEAKTYETNANTAAANAETAKLAAEAAKVAAESAQAGAESSAGAASESATEAKTSEDNAAASAVTSSGFASDAEAAAAAKVSEINSKASEVSADESEANATTEADRAKTEADRAETAMVSKLDKEDIAGFFKGYETKALADADVANRVVDEKVLVWNQNGPTYSWYKVIDTAGVLSLELESDEAKMLSVNNIRPDTNGNVQVTIPGGNPSLWLGEVTWFPYDKDNTIGYSGVLLADGREVRRVDYPDTWTAIETGLIPSVTESEWQAGSNMYYSTGDGSTTFRLPNLLQGQAFRAPSAGEDDTDKVTAQVPYVATVSGNSPDDNGNITLDTSDVAGLGSMAVQDANNVAITGGNAKLGSTYAAPFVLESVNPTIQFKESDNATGDYRFVFDSGSFRMQLGATANYAFAYDYPGNKFKVPALESITAIPLTSGGTGAKTSDDARKNLEVVKLSRTALNVNLDTLYGLDSVGEYFQPSNSEATLANNYPVQAAGALSIKYSGAGSVNEATQLYYPYNANNFYRRLGTSVGGVISWGAWELFSTDTVLKAYSDGQLNSLQFTTGLSVTGSIINNDANLLAYNGFYAGSGASGFNFLDNYTGGIVMRRVNTVTQLQVNSMGIGWRYCNNITATEWSNWVRVVNTGDYGVGTTHSPPSGSTNQFISDANAGAYNPANGAGIQSAYASNRLFQLWMATNNGLYIRYNDSGNPTVDKAVKPWTMLQAAGTSDANVKNILGSLEVEGSLDNISRMEFKLFKYVYDAPERSARRGVIAQQIETIDKEYVHSAETSGVMTLDLNPLVMDSLAAIKALKKRDEANQAEIKDLKTRLYELEILVQTLLPNTPEARGE